MEIGCKDGRYLDANEELLYLCDSVSPFNFVFILSVSGNFSGEDCIRAISCVKRMHPLLNARITCVSFGRLAFVTDFDEKISFETYRVCVGDVRRFVEIELASPFDTENGPLIRFTRLQHETENSTILFSVHHSIGDGISGCILVRDFLCALVLSESEFPVGSLPSPINERLPAAFRGVRGLCAHAVAGFHMMKSLVVHGAPAKYALRDAISAGRVPIVTIREVCAAQLEKIIVCSRVQNCSMQGVLGAALLLAVKKSCSKRGKGGRGLYKKRISSKPMSLQLLSPVDIRRRLSPAVGDEFGLYVATQATNHRMSDEKQFWQLATEISKELHNSIRLNSPMAFMPMASKYLVKLVSGGGRIFGVSRFTQWVCKTFPPCIGLSNLGVVDIPSKYGHVTLERVGFSASLSALGCISGFSMCFSGTLFWNFVGMSPSVDRDYLENIADAAINNMLSACNI